MEVIISSQVTAIDENCEYLSIKRLQLMENAITAIANTIKNMAFVEFWYSLLATDVIIYQG